MGPTEEEDPELEAWRIRQEAERERLKLLNYTPPPPARPPKGSHLRPAGSLDSLLGIPIVMCAEHGAAAAAANQAAAHAMAMPPFDLPNDSCNDVIADEDLKFIINQPCSFHNIMVH